MKKYITITNVDKSSDPQVIQFNVNDEAKSKYGNTAMNIRLSAEEYNRYYFMEKNFNEQTLIMLIVKFETILSNVFRYIFEKYPNKYLNKETLSYADILNIGEGNIKDYIIDTLVSNTMRESVNDWMKIFKSHGIDFAKYKKLLDRFLEIHYRRNIVVHNGSFVNEPYLKGIEKTDLSKPKIGEFLYISRDYITHAFNVIECFLFTIFIECTKIQDKDEKKKYIDVLFDIGFDFLYNKEYVISEFVFKTLEKQPLDENTLLMSKVNRWIAQKELYGLDKITEELNDCDFSAKDIKFRIAKDTILENYDMVVNNLEIVFPNIFPAEVLLEWPLFLRFRESEIFEQFKSAHPEEFEIQQITPSESLEELQETALTD